MQTRETKNITYHLGNVLTVITDEKRMVLNGSNYLHYESVVVSVTDYSPFGVSVTGRTFTTTEGYRYGFNGMESDPEHNSGAYDFGARIMDARLGRWMSVDPLFNLYPSMSTYTGMNNSPILIIDPSGCGGIVSNITRGKDGHYYGQLTFNVYMYSDEVSTENINRSLVESGLGDGYSYMTEGAMLMRVPNKEDQFIYLNVTVNISVITCEDAKAMIEAETNSSNNYIYINSTTASGLKAAYTGGSNFNGRNQGSLAMETFKDERAPGFLLHELWHSVAKYYCTRPECEGLWLYGEHNNTEEWSIMQSHGLTMSDYLTQKDFYATAIREPRKSGLITTNFHSIELKKGDYNNQKNGFPYLNQIIGGEVCNEYMIDDSGERCALLNEGGCTISPDTCPK